MTNHPMLRIVSRAGLALVLLLGCGSAFAQVTVQLPDRMRKVDEAAKAAEDPKQAKEAKDATVRSVKLVRVIEQLPFGAPWLELKVSCIYQRLTQTAGARKELQLSPFSDAFKIGLSGEGYQAVNPGEDNLFDPGAGSTDLEVAAVITDLRVEGCISPGDIFSQRGAVKGASSMAVDWQVYSRLSKQVVVRMSTRGSSTLTESTPGGLDRLINESFGDNASRLASSADFRAAVLAPKALTEAVETPLPQSKIVLAGSLKIRKRQIADATGSVVTILTGLGSGSGFLVSTDGYILTDAHVVGDEKNVRVRWSDGLETLATVERVAKTRDVAIIKTNPRDRAPLALRRGPVLPGQRVYAIGSPAGKKFEGTVSSGVVSADRMYDGLRYIQSDTTVSHGSSGGPLLDENGAVIGLTDLGIPNMGPTGQDGPAGLNLFTPIGDAMDFLSLEQR